MAGLNKEYWLEVVKEQYDQVPTFLSALEDLSAFVNNNKINLAEAGIDPEIVINLAQYPIPVVPRSDINHELTLDTYDSENTPVFNAAQKELSYDMMASYLRRHSKAILNKIAQYGTFNLTPAADSEFTPVIPTTGTTALVAGFKDITEDDIFNLADRFDAIDAPDSERVLVLHDKHFNQLLRTSSILKEQQKYQTRQGEINRNVYRIADFDIYKYKSRAVFNKTTGAKKAWGAEADAATDTISSFAFVKGEVAKAMGTLDMFELLKDPYTRSDIVGFQQRAMVTPMRNKYIASIYSAAV